MPREINDSWLNLRQFVKVNNLGLIEYYPNTDNVKSRADSRFQQSYREMMNYAKANIGSPSLGKSADPLNYQGSIGNLTELRNLAYETNDEVMLTKYLDVTRIKYLVFDLEFLSEKDVAFLEFIRSNNKFKNVTLNGVTDFELFENTLNLKYSNNLISVSNNVDATIQNVEDDIYKTTFDLIVRTPSKVSFLYLKSFSPYWNITVENATKKIDLNPIKIDFLNFQSKNDSQTLNKEYGAFNEFDLEILEEGNYRVEVRFTPAFLQMPLFYIQFLVYLLICLIIIRKKLND
jgi:hypothetical protein